MARPRSSITRSGRRRPDTYDGLDYSDIGLRAKLWSTGDWVFSGEAAAFIPGAHDAKAPAEEGNTGWAGEARLNAGTNFKVGSTPGFMDAEFGYRLRTQGPPNEWHGDLTVGFKFTPRLMLMLQDFTTVSSPSTNPTFLAWRQSVVEASVVYAFDDKWSVQARPVLDGVDGQDQHAARRGACRVAEFLTAAFPPSRALLEQFAPDQHAPDLARAGADLVELGVAQEAPERIVVGVAVSA